MSLGPFRSFPECTFSIINTPLENLHPPPFFGNSEWSLIANISLKILIDFLSKIVLTDFLNFRFADKPPHISWYQSGFASCATSAPHLILCVWEAPICWKWYKVESSILHPLRWCCMLAQLTSKDCSVINAQKCYSWYNCLTLACFIFPAKIVCSSKRGLW